MTSPCAATQSRFVQILPERLDSLCAERGLGPHERRLLLDLLLDASWQTHALEGFTLTDYAARLGFGPSHRRTLKAQMLRLEAAGVIRYEAGRGARPGRVEILAYREVVRERAAGRAVTTAPRHENARPASDFARRYEEEIEDPPSVGTDTSGPADLEDGGDDSLAQAEEVLAVVAARLEPGQRRDLLRPDPQRAQLLAGIARLLEHVTAADIVEGVLRPRLPEDIASVAGLLWYRVRRRLAEVQALEDAPPGPPAEDGRRESAWAHGEALGRTPDAHIARSALECAYAADPELLEVALGAEAETRSRLNLRTMAS